MTYVPVDFERKNLAEGLISAGFIAEEQTFFSWLGVVPYLTETAVWSTLGFIAGLCSGTHVVFDYSNQPALFSPKMRIAHERRAAQVAKLGEAFITFFETDKLHAQLIEMGFVVIEDGGPPQMFARFLPEFTGYIPEKGGHVLHAITGLKSK